MRLQLGLPSFPTIEHFQFIFAVCSSLFTFTVLAPIKRVELLTYCLEGSCSIQLS